jgi:hypothetical protein
MQFEISLLQSVINLPRRQEGIPAAMTSESRKTKSFRIPRHTTSHCSPVRRVHQIRSKANFLHTALGELAITLVVDFGMAKESRFCNQVASNFSTHFPNLLENMPLPFPFQELIINSLMHPCFALASESLQCIKTLKLFHCLPKQSCRREPHLALYMKCLLPSTEAP